MDHPGSSDREVTEKVKKLDIGETEDDTTKEDDPVPGTSASPQQNGEIRAVQEKYENLQEKYENLQRQMKKLELHEEIITNKLRKYEEEIINLRRQIQVPALRYVFLILDLADDDFNYDYCVICCQRRELNNRLTKLKVKHPNHKVIYRKEDSPDPIMLWNEIQEELDGNIKVFNKYFELLNGYIVEDVIDVANYLCKLSNPNN